MISRKLALEVLNAGLSTGADYSEIYFQSKYSHLTSLAKKQVDNVYGALTYGVGIRLLKGTDVVYGYTSDLSRPSLLKLAARLSEGFTGERVLTVEELRKAKVSHRDDPLKSHESMSTDEKIAFLKKVEAAAYAVDSKIVDVGVTLNEQDEEVAVYNSEGTVTTDRRTRTRFNVNAVASDGTNYESAFFGPGFSCGLELLDRYDFVAGAERVARRAVELLSAPECPSGEMSVVIGNAFGGTLFHEACGHPLEGSAISHGTSPFAGKLGQQVASSLVTAVDDGTIPGAWGSEGYDDEGVKSTKNVLIKDGILQNYMLDRVTARKLDLTPTGSCRRQSYRYLPTTRMTNTYIAPGSSTKEEIIAKTEKGIYLQDFTGGSVDPTTDKFNFSASSAYLIEHGKLTTLVKSACLVGFGYEVLKNIDMVGDDCVRAAGICGAASGLVPVEVGQPTIRVSKMIVGGRGGNI